MKKEKNNFNNRMSEWENKVNSYVILRIYHHNLKFLNLMVSKKNEKMKNYT